MQLYFTWFYFSNFTTSINNSPFFATSACPTHGCGCCKLYYKLIALFKLADNILIKSTMLYFEILPKVSVILHLTISQLQTVSCPNFQHKIRYETLTSRKIVKKEAMLPQYRTKFITRPIYTHCSSYFSIPGKLFDWQSICCWKLEFLKKNHKIRYKVLAIRCLYKIEIRQAKCKP